MPRHRRFFYPSNMFKNSSSRIIIITSCVPIQKKSQTLEVSKAITRLNFHSIHGSKNEVN